MGMSMGLEKQAVCGYCGGAARSGDFCCYGCRVLAEGGGVAREDGGGKAISGWWRVGAGALVSGQSMLLGLAANVDGPDGPGRAWVHGGLFAGACVALGLLGPGLVREACRCAARGRMAVEWLFIVGAMAAMAASVQASVTGRGAVYYEVVSVLVTVHAVGKALTATARSRAMEEAGRLEKVFGTARRVDGNGRGEEMSAASVRAGERIRVGLGEAIPNGGVVVRGTAWVQESALTGELLPVVKRAGDAVRAGGVALDGELEVEVTGDGGRGELEALMALLREARDTVEETAAWGRATRWAGWFLPVVLGVAAGTLVLGWERLGPGAAVYRALSVVLVACPCALGLSVPLGLWSALSVLATRGVRLRRASAVERLAGVTHVCVDKTGTLTALEPVLVDFVGVGGEADRRRWLGWMSALEARAGGVWAGAFAGVARDERGKVEVRGVSWVAGAGIEGEAREADGAWRRVRAGRLEWAGTCGEEGMGALAGAGDGDARLAFSVDGEVVGVARVRERRLPCWEERVRSWERMGCCVEVLSGDAPGRLEAFGCGGRVRLNGSMTAEAKAARVREIRAGGGRVLFVGDGLNDGMALRAADVGLAVMEGSATARVLADGEIGAGRLDLVTEALGVSRGALRAVDGSLVFAVGYNVLGMAMAALGVLGPVWAALLMTGSSVVVAWRSVRGARCENGVGDATVGRGWEEWMIAGSLALQAPMGAWLGAMGVGQALGIGVACVTGAAWVLASGRLGRVGRMTAGMLGPGNLMMLMGWWVDAGFGVVMEKGVCLCCRSHHYFEAGWRVPWMWAGMLAGGLPWMWGMVSRWRGWIGRGMAAGWLSATMLAGMAWGGGAAVGWLEPMSRWQFVAAWGGMTLGMLAGMGLGCGALEAARVAMAGWRWEARRARGEQD